MSTTSHFFVAVGMVAAAAAMPILVTRPLPPDSGAPSAQIATVVANSAAHPELDDRMAGLRDMRKRLAAAEPGAARSALLVESEQVLSDGVELMRRLKRNLPVSATGMIVPEFVTAAQSADIEDFLGLTALLVQLKADRDALLAPVHPSGHAAPVQVLPTSATSISAKGFA